MSTVTHEIKEWVYPTIVGSGHSDEAHWIFLGDCSVAIDTEFKVFYPIMNKDSNVDPDKRVVK